jgi:hypothetical protein
MKMTDNIQGQEIPDEPLFELMNRAQERVEERFNHLRSLEKKLEKKASYYASFARYMKIFIIVIGSIVATRVVADRLWEPPPNQKGSRHSIEIIYTLCSICIAIIGGLDGVFKPGELATELSYLKVNCGTIIYTVEGIWAKDVERNGACRKALENSDPLLKRLDQVITETVTRLAQLRVHLDESQEEQNHEL